MFSTMHIITTGPPTFAKARRLSPEKYAAAKPSLTRCHLLTWSVNHRVTGHPHFIWFLSQMVTGAPAVIIALSMQQLNPIVTLCHMFRISLSARFAGCKIFSKIDLVRVYH